MEESGPVDDPGVTRLSSFRAHHGFITIAAGSVVDFRGGAIVNAANEGGISGGGVDGAINARGGPDLVEARRALPKLPGRSIRIPTGSAKTTEGGALDATWAVRRHAVVR